MKKVILINGKARHGKDTVGQYLYKQLSINGNSVLITHYGDLLKYICKEFLGWNGKKDERGRTMLQNVGTNVVRKKYPNYWVDFILQMADFFSECWDYIVIPDVRFPNEINLWKEKGYDVVTINVNRPDFNNGLTEEQNKHESETYDLTSLSDIFISNDGSKQDLFDKVKEIIKGGL